MWDTLAAAISNYDLRMVNICTYKNGHGMGMVYGIGFTTINIDLCLPLLPLKQSKTSFFFVSFRHVPLLKAKVEPSRNGLER
jgi:hypothetical protein